MADPLSRRQAISLGLGAVALGVLRAGLAGCADTTKAPNGPGGTSASTPGSGTTGTTGTAPPHPASELVQPPTIQSTNGVLSTTLTAETASVEVGAPKPLQTYTYDGGLPGSTWEIHAGDTMKIQLVNNLPVIDHAHADNPNRPHDWTTTNLHTHGLHVSPSGNADNIFLEVPPGGGTQQYEIKVPADHPGGLFWYHPHSHGAVAQQVRGGMAGAIVVRGAIDEVPEVKAAKEQLIVVQAIEVGKDYQLLDPIPEPTKTEAFVPRTQILYPINGVVNPKITMYPGEVQRWRILNAAEGKFLSLRLADHEFNVLAWDGLNLAAPDPIQDAFLGGGNRMEVLVQAGAAGTYDLVLTPGSSQHPEIPGSPNPTTPPTSVSAELVARTILTVEVTGSGPPMALPKKLPVYDPPIHPIARTREVQYTVQRTADGEFIDFGIDGQPFDPERPPYQAKLGTAEEWTLTNAADSQLVGHAHVFHIHVNPFKVTKINGQTLATPLWRDTYVLTGTTGDSFTFETNFDDFTGMFVEHCHVLTHEDLGMMERIEVVP